jgi:arylsulfatase
MKPKFFPGVLALFCALSLLAAPASSRLPNIVLIFADDLGYADLGCYGAKGFATPNLDRLAREGTRFTSFYVSSPVCSASRAALMTGCYHSRVGIHGALGPNAKIGIHSNEVTMAELLKTRGYATAIVGKWHLGRPPQFLPPHHGFDEYFGLPYSNDMWPRHPTAQRGTYPPLPLIEGTNVVEEMPDQRQLTTRYTERAVQFIERNRERPFFLYVAHNMPHVPLHVSDKFAGKSARGLYGDVIEEIDWSVGQVLDALRRHNLEENTWVIFTSDNGPWHSYGNHAGSAGPLREGKGCVYEGGVREPCVMRWPGKIPAGRVCGDPLMTIDLFPTIARQAGAALPRHKIDGLDVWPILSGAPGAKNPHDAYFFYFGSNELQALRSGKWKLILPHTVRIMNGQPGGTNGQPARYTQVKAGLELYDLEKDLGETTNVAEQNLDVVKRLHGLAEKAREDLGDSLTKRKGRGQREPGRVPAAEGS